MNIFEFANIALFFETAKEKMDYFFGNLKIVFSEFVKAANRVYIGQRYVYGLHGLRLRGVLRWRAD